VVRQINQSHSLNYIRKHDRMAHCGASWQES
jgi:hypothetical protein